MKIFAAIAGLMVLFSPNARAEGSAATVEIPPEIRQQIDKVIPRQAPVTVLRRLSGKIDSGGTHTAVERVFERADSGLWGVTTAMIVRGALVRSVLSLQGIVELSATAAVDRDFKLDSVLPVGKTFVPYGVSRNVKANASMAVTSLSGDLEALTAPTAGGKFHYARSSAGQNTVTTTGLFGGTKTMPISVTAKAHCSAGSEADASAVHPALRGRYLPVTCDVEFNGSSRTEEYAYLVDSALYVLLAAGGEKYTVERVEYMP